MKKAINMADSPKLKVKSEHAEQVMLFQWLAKCAFGGIAYADGESTELKPIPQLRFAFAIPNGGARADNRNVAAIRGSALKLEGVRRGVPDIMIPVPFGEYHGLFIEMKVSDPKRGKVSTQQKEYLEYLNSCGYRAVVCYGEAHAKQVIRHYFNH